MSDQMISQDDINEAAQAENQIMQQDASVLLSTNQYLNNRVILLRARVAQLEKENAELRGEPPVPPKAKKAAAKKAAPKKK